MQAQSRINESLFGDEDDDGCIQIGTLRRLSPAETSVFQFIVEAAQEDRYLDPNDDIAHALGWSGTGTVRGVMVRLEKAGYITTESYMRGRRVYVRHLEKWTAKPSCETPHWSTVLNRSRATPSVPKHRVGVTIMDEINRLMRERCIPFVEAQLVLMAYGVQALHIERA